ncbi:MAG: transcriptional repressor [Eubacterium sp.]|nr:transcriptional repressor [Eubacterium sp.]MDD7209025.1 transcriptional repressor [Lachnospiraceae bacterium]MDY5497264.1 transcriptional repressor [Anaerobutyricum sp.]
MSAPMKNSRQRNAILQCVMDHHDHPTADVIYQELRKTFPNISLGTVYRNLSLLTSLGKIRKITCEDHADRFDGHTSPHAHFVCKSCGRLQDISYLPSVEPDQEIGDDFDGIISDYTITFQGYCHECASRLKQEETPAV